MSKVISKRVKRKGHYYVYYYAVEHGKKKLLTTTKWSSNKKQREKYKQIAKVRIERKLKEKWEEGYLITAYQNAFLQGDEGATYGGITVRWAGKAKIRMEDGQVIDWEYTEDVSTKEKFAEVLHEVFLRIADIVGMQYTKTATDYDVLRDWSGISGEEELGKRLYFVEAEQKGRWIIITKENLGRFKRNMLLDMCKNAGLWVKLKRRGNNEG